ncbi:MAG TPA: DUF4381 family protein [Planctomycetota bacterium]|nr:DUF4381 family protein [Planctomycetota bacterium]
MLELSRSALRSLALIVLCAALVAGDAVATPTVTMSAAPAQVDVGREVTVTLSYAWPAGWTVVAEPDPARDFAALFVTSFPPVEKIATGEAEERRWRLTVLAPQSGAWSLPRPTLTVRAPDGAEHRAQAPEVIVAVGTANAPAQLAAARPLWTRPESVIGDDHDAWRWIAVAICALLAAAIAAIVLRRRAAESGPTAHARFHAALAGVRSAGDGKEAGARLSLALRAFAGATWRFDGAGSTTRELAQLLKPRAPEGETRTVVRMLEELDGLRWSPDQLPASQVTPLIDEARSWADGVQRRLDEEARAALAEKRAKRTDRAASATKAG